jgi:hypothetical protein
MLMKRDEKLERMFVRRKSLVSRLTTLEVRNVSRKRNRPMHGGRQEKGERQTPASSGFSVKQIKIEKELNVQKIKTESVKLFFYPE